MIIKSFTAPTVAAALKMVREKIGGDAVVLKTRMLSESEAGRLGSRVEVTVCIDEAVVSPIRLESILAPEPPVKKRLNIPAVSAPKDSGPAAPEPTEKTASRISRLLETDLEKSINPEPEETVGDAFETVYLDLLDADVPAEYARQIIKIAEGRLLDETNPATLVMELMAGEIETLLASDIKFKTGQRVAFVGSSGSGKTSALAKMAASLTAESRLKVKLCSLDDMKISAFEEIGGYADILNLPLAMSESINSDEKSEGVILIDTPSIPHDNRSRLQLVKRLRALKPDFTFLVFSACARTRDLLENINLYEAMMPTHLIAGHLDETLRWGGLIALARYLEIPVAFGMDSPGGIGRLRPVRAEEIVRILLKQEEVLP